LYLEHIPIDLYGAWLASGNVLTWLTVIDPGISTVVTQRVGKSFGANKLEAVFAYAFWGILITLCIVVLVIFLGFEVSSHISSWTQITDSNENAKELQNNFKLVVLATGVTLVAFAVGAVNLGLQATFAHGMNYLLANTLSLFATIVLLFSNAGLWAITIGLAVRSVVFLIGGMVCMCLLFLRFSIRSNFQISFLWEILRLISFTSIGRIGETVARNADAFLIARFIGVQFVPVYTLSKRGFSVAEMLLNRIAHGVGPSLSHLQGEVGRGKRVNEVVLNVLKINVWVLPLAFIGFLTLNESFIKLWVGSEFFVGNTISMLMCCLLLFSTLSTSMYVICIALGDLEYSSKIYFFQSVVTLFLLILGLNYIGLIGAVLAPIIGYVCFSTWYFPKSLKKRTTIIRSDWELLGKETLYSVSVAILTFFIVRYLIRSPLNWAYFMMIVFTAFSIYFAIMSLVSSELRKFLSLFLHLYRRAKL
jgi:O-antigen/teichoic acid export membrane protein